MPHPERLGKYPITAVIGEGAMGVVYKAVDPVIERTVAIKTVHKHLLADGEGVSFAERFRNEARSAGRISHPNIVAVHEYGEDEHNAFIVMEFAPGRTLAQQLAAEPLPAQADILRVMDQLLDALDCAHRHGVWHRDVKPANLIVTAARQLKVTDFGVARIASAALTQTSSAIGTPGYMAPEQYLGIPVDQRVDIFAAGVVLYRMLAGRAPFTGTAEALMYQLFNGTTAPPSRVAGSGRDSRFDMVVARAMAREPAERFHSAAEFRLALAAAAAIDGTTVVRPRPAAAPPPAAATETFPPTRAEPTGWDAAVLAPMEAALATLIGPLAKVLVRQAARGSADLGSLATRVAEHIGDSAQREAFVTRFARPAAERSDTTPTPPSGNLSTPLPAELIAHANRVLTSQLGPIARIVVRKAAAKASTREQFFRLLADDAGTGIDRNRLLTELERGGA